MSQFNLKTLIPVLVGLMTLAAQAGPGTAPEPAPVAPAAQAPLSYFNDKCARCHGPYGVFYGADFGKKLSDAQLRKVVADMAAGPGQAPLGEAQLDVQTAYHRSLVDGRPFVAVTGLESSAAGLKLTGEATPGATVQVVADKPSQQSVSATLDGHTWAANLLAGTAPGAVQITVAKDGQETTIELAKTAYSHRQGADRP